MFSLLCVHVFVGGALMMAAPQLHRTNWVPVTAHSQLPILAPLDYGSCDFPWIRGTRIGLFVLCGPRELRDMCGKVKIYSLSYTLK